VAELGQLDTDGENRRDFLDTAAVISQLDLVVSPETAVAHLAGSLGVRVWVALSYAADWRWLLDRDDSPWYPTMRLFRQTKPGDWEGVFSRMADTLRSELVS
jgi:ADP-heptose:LPS heptosyltransferase